MKTLVILALAAVGTWYVLTQLKQNKDVRKAQDAAVEATASMQQSVRKAEDAAAAANKAIQSAASQVEDAVK